MDNEKKRIFGGRMTSSNPEEIMQNNEWMLNNCYAEAGKAMYRDHDGEYDIRHLITEIGKTLGIHINATSPDALDFMLYDWLEDGIESRSGILAMLYNLLWSKAELYEHLKKYENAEERGEIGRVPRWIPVAEKLPVEAGKREEAYCFVFVQDVQNKTNFFTTAVFYGDTQGWDLDFINECSPPFPIYVVTHWMDMNRDIPDISDTELLGVTQNGKTTLSTIIERGRIVGVKCGDEYADYFAYNNADRCVCCGDVIPEGRQVCPACEAGEQT